MESVEGFPKLYIYIYMSDGGKGSEGNEAQLGQVPGAVELGRLLFCTKQPEKASLTIRS